MELPVATQLISGGVKHSSTPQRWADLGAGSGLFTRALSWLLPSQSVIDAIDKSPQIRNGITGTAPNIRVNQIEQDLKKTLCLLLVMMA